MLIVFSTYPLGGHTESRTLAPVTFSRWRGLYVTPAETQPGAEPAAPPTSARKRWPIYSHVRIEAKRKALDALATLPVDRPTHQRGAEGGYDTNNDTKQSGRDEQAPEVIESMVDLTGIEPVTSSLRTMRSPS